ncbi:hypothetical protein MNAN1_002173 [Malassezia nana]|uniref:Uncharacterized protein n=1 Tax=Malassezia nana TaxID=180528 RepID=A0AAF0EIU8_9BASI|nr:hypothetical protein MNAN1_002173 [Malassezia nana]
MLGWTFPSYMPTAMLQKEVERMTANPKSYKPEALRSVLSYYHWNMDRLPRPHTIAWRDILAVALGSNDASLVGAAEKALKTLEELYNGQTYEAKLEKRTWTLRSNAPLLERARLLREARENCPRVCLMDYIDESLDDDHILSPMMSSTVTTPTGNDMLLSDSHERPWLSDVDELYASLVWHSESDDDWNMSDDDEIPSDLPPPDGPAQSSDSGSESQDEDTSSESSESESSSTSESSTESSESDADMESENSAEEVASSLKRPNPYPLPPTKRMRPDDPA